MGRAVFPKVLISWLVLVGADSARSVGTELWHSQELSEVLPSPAVCGPNQSFPWQNEKRNCYRKKISRSLLCIGCFFRFCCFPSCNIQEKSLHHWPKEPMTEVVFSLKTSGGDGWVGWKHRPKVEHVEGLPLPWGPLFKCLAPQLALELSKGVS